MKIGRFDRIMRFNESVVLNCLWVIVLIIACNFSVIAYAQTEGTAGAEPEDMKDATVTSDLEELLTTVYCYCGCVRETIEVCTCSTAMNIENNFRDRLLAGEPVEQIRTNYLDTYGPQYYAVMPVEGINLLAYIMPAVILIVIGGVVFVVLRKSRQRASATANAQVASESQPSDEAVKQVETELERYKRES